MVHRRKISKRVSSLYRHCTQSLQNILPIPPYYETHNRSIQNHCINFASTVNMIFSIWDSTYITQGSLFFEKRELERHLTPSLYFITLVSAICPIATSPLIQQSNKLDWKRFIAYNSFMRALPMHWDVTALERGRLIGLWGHLWRDVRHEESPFAMAALQQLLQLYTSVLFVICYYL